MPNNERRHRSDQWWRDYAWDVLKGMKACSNTRARQEYLARVLKMLWEGDEGYLAPGSTPETSPF